MMFNAKSSSVLEDLNVRISGNMEKEQLLDFNTFGPSYSEKWVYITRKPYLEAKIWPLSITSFGLLRPNIIRDMLVVAAPTCPNLAHTPQLDGKVSDAIKSSLPNFGSSTVAMIKAANQFSEFVMRTSGNYLEQEIKFTTNGFMIVAFVLSAVLAVFGAVVMFILLVKLNKLMNLEYEDFLES